MGLEDKLFLNRYRVDSVPHIQIKDAQCCLQCARHQCTLICPVDVYKWDAHQQKIVVGWENCVETGACLVACNEFNNINMTYPRGGYGISYQFG